MPDLPTVSKLAAALRQRHPNLTDHLDDITHLTAEIATTRPLALSCINPGDGLRSPNLDGGAGSKGGVSRPTETTALAHLERGRLTTNRADSLIDDATHALRLALSVAPDPKATA